MLPHGVLFPSISSSPPTPAPLQQLVSGIAIIVLDLPLGSRRRDLANNATNPPSIGRFIHLLYNRCLVSTAHCSQPSRSKAYPAMHTHSQQLPPSSENYPFVRPLRRTIATNTPVVQLYPYTLDNAIISFVELFTCRQSMSDSIQ